MGLFYFSQCSKTKNTDIKEEGYIATANRSRVNIRGRRCKIFLASLMITQNSLVASHAMCAHVGGSPFFLGGGEGWGLWPRPVEMGA